ncbi:MAG: serine protease [Neomegalonema sp.]|nr:serine protease [Neomegalonema sp.]
MAQGSFYLTKTDAVEADLLLLGTTPVIERYEALVSVLEKTGGGSLTALFAEPVLSRSNGQSAATISWYTSVGGDVTPLLALDEEQRSEAERSLRSQLLKAAEAIKDPELGPLVGAALHLRSLEDVYVVGHQPVLINWGMTQGGSKAPRNERDAHFNAALGRYLPFDEAPPVSSEEWRGRLSGVVSALAAGGSASAAAAAQAAVDQQAGGASTGSASQRQAAPVTPPPMPQNGAGGGGAGSASGSAPAPMPASSAAGSRWSWLAPAILLGLMSLALIWLLLPGTLLYPPAAQTSVIDDEAALAALRDTNRALEERRDALREALRGAQCTPSGDLVLPGQAAGDPARRPDGTLPAQLGEDGQPVPRDPISEGAADALLPADPSRVQIPQEGADPASLLDYIEARTAIVVVQGASKAGAGTGFFIGPDLLVSNHHVVTGAGPNPRIFVTNKALGKLTPAQVIRSSGPLESNGDDFAVLKVEGAAMPFFPVRDSAASIRLQNVIAAGFPASYLQTDSQWSQLQAGDASAVPGLVVTRGFVSAEQNFGGATQALVHSADISPGNSGGPLVDACGRVVGINTFGRRDEATQRFLNFSLHSRELLSFLAEAGVSATTASEPCRPQIAAQTPPPSTEPEPDAPQASGEAPAADPSAGTPEGAQPPATQSAPE